MAKDDVQLKKTDSIVDEVTRLHEDISRRAYAFFEGRGGFMPDPAADWFRAEYELVWSPAIEVRQRDGMFEVEASIAGIEPKDLDVQVTPQDILIKGQTQHKHEEAKGTLHTCEFRSGQLFRSIHLPEPIVTDSVKAELRHGILRLTAAIAKSESGTATKVDVKAA